MPQKRQHLIQQVEESKTNKSNKEKFELCYSCGQKDFLFRALARAEEPPSSSQTINKRLQCPPFPLLPLPTTHPILASSFVVPPCHHPSHISPPLILGNTFPIITSSALPTPPPPQPSLPTPPRSSWIESLRSLARLNLFRDAISTYADMMALAGIPPNQFAFLAVLKVTTGLRDLNLGR
ncbi:hypothetical protein NL676_032202 [Syzygium grande]|nr:hypothetical protein NL676_032202 [Syzygium grande]